MKNKNFKFTLLWFITIGILTHLLSSCTANPDKRSKLLIKSKELTINDEIGKYKYYINISFLSENLILYSDSNWNVGEELHKIKNKLIHIS